MDLLYISLGAKGGTDHLDTEQRNELNQEQTQTNQNHPLLSSLAALVHPSCCDQQPDSPRGRAHNEWREAKRACSSKHRHPELQGQGHLVHHLGGPTLGSCHAFVCPWSLCVTATTDSI